MLDKLKGLIWEGSAELRLEVRALGLDPEGKSVAEMEDMLAMALWARRHPGEPFPAQYAAMLAQDATTNSAEWFRTSIKSTDWWLQTKKNGMRSLLELTSAGLRASSRDKSVADYLYVEHHQNVLTFVGAKSPFKGKTVLDGELMAPTKRVDTGKVVTSSELQACCGAEVRILTDRGLLSIGELYSQGVGGLKVFTGKGLSDFVVLDMGERDLYEVEFCNGAKIVVDGTHKCLRRWNSHSGKRKWFSEGFEALVGNPRMKWVFRPVAQEFVDWVPEVCISEGSWNRTELNLAYLRGQGLEEFVYWIGRFVGDGVTSGVDRVDDGGAASVTLHFGCHERGEAGRYCAFLKKLGYEVGVSDGCRSLKVDLTSKSLWEVFQAFGWNPDGRAKTKNIPGFIWRASVKLRKEFLRGWLDADGYRKRGTIKSVSEVLIREGQLLCLSVGLDATVQGPYEYGGCVSWNLLLTEGKRTEPAVGVRSVKFLRRDKSFTLSVNAEEHSYWSNGLVSQNCVALVHMETERSLAMQRKIGTLSYHCFDLLFYEGDDVRSAPYEKRAELADLAVKRIQEANPSIAVFAEPVIREYDDVVKVFMDKVAAGEEGIMLKKRSGKYAPGKRSGELLKYKRLVTIDGWISGATLSSEDKGHKDLIGGFQMSAFVDGRERVIANVSGIELAVRREATLLKDGKPTLNPEFLGRVIQVVGQEWTKNNLLVHARFDEPRPDKRKEDCQLNSSDMYKG